MKTSLNSYKFNLIKSTKTTRPETSKINGSQTQRPTRQQPIQTKAPSLDKKSEKSTDLSSTRILKTQTSVNSSILQDKKIRTLSTTSRPSTSPIRVRPLTLKEQQIHSPVKEKKPVQQAKSNKLNQTTVMSIKTPPRQQAKPTEKFVPSQRQSTKTVQNKQEKSKSLMKSTLVSEYSSPRARTPQNKIEPLYSIVRPIVKDALYYQTSLIHFHYELLKGTQSPHQFLFNLEYNTPELRNYFRDLYQDHFQQNFNCLQYCKRFIDKKITTKQKKLASSEFKRTLIFDLDETLIHCNDQNNDPVDFTLQVNVPGEGFVETRINVRPYCQQMLKILSRHYEIILFTASYQYYADKVLEIVDPDKNIFSYRLYRDSCIEVEEGLFVKDLRIINRSLENVIIVDNAAYSYCLQLDNGIPIIPFYDNKYDKELLFLTDYLLKLEKKQSLLYQNKIQFRQYLYLQCQQQSECLHELFKIQYT